MKTYYVLIHWDKGSAVTGFLAPNSKDEKHAIQMIKKTLLVRKKLGSETGELSQHRVNLFLKALKRPWRFNFRDKLDAERRNDKNYKQKTTVEVKELSLPTIAGYWLTDICSDRHLCNIP